MSLKRAMIWGVTGQDGSFLSELLLKNGYKVIGVKRRTSTINTSRIDHLYHDPNFKLEYGEMNDVGSMYRLLRQYAPDEIYNLAAQSHVRVSFENPEATVDTVAMGTLRLLEAIREVVPDSKFYQASSSEMFGDNPILPLNEESKLQPCSPYACAKVFSHNIVNNYRESYGMFACSGILMNHECFYEDTPVIIKNINDNIDIVYISSLVPRRKNVDKDNNYLEKDYNNSGIKVWDGEDFVDLLMISRKKISFLEEQNRKRVISNARNGCVSTTPNHKFVDENEQKIENRFCTLEKTKLKSGIYPKNFVSNNAFSNDFCKLVGLLCGDGFIGEKSFRLINSNSAIIEEFKKLCNRCFCNVSFNVKEYKSGFGGITTNVGVSSVPVEIVSYLRKELYELKTKHKKVPSFILNSSIENKHNFLSGYYLADGLKRGRTDYEFESFTTNSPILAQGILYLVTCVTKQDFNINVEFRDDKRYYHVNLLSPNSNDKVGNAFKNRNVLKKKQEFEVKNQHVYDIETKSGIVMAGIGNLVVGNSQRRGETFVSKKITTAAAMIKHNLQDKLFLGNLEAKRDWGYAKEFASAMHLMLQQEIPEDFVIATGESHSVREFCEVTFDYLGLGDYNKYIEIDPRLFRPQEVPHLLGDFSKAKQKLGWEPKVKFEQLVKIMVDYDLTQIKEKFKIK